MELPIKLLRDQIKDLNPIEKRKIVKRFFEAHPYNTTMELARMSGLHPKTIYTYRKRLGIESKLKSDFNLVSGYILNKKKMPEQVTDPNIWDNKEWFEEFYVKRGFGINKLQKIIGKSFDVIMSRLKKYGIAVRKWNSETNNPYCSREWLMEHYVKGRKSLGECAKLANVSKYTICCWLSKHDIEIRGSIDYINKVDKIRNKRKMNARSILHTDGKGQTKIRDFDKID